MRVLVVNPNSTVSMTEGILAAARAAAAPDMQVEAITNAGGPPAIQGEADGARALPGVISAVQAARGFDAVVIACFDDTGLAEVRAAVSFPVIGIGEAAYHAAMLFGGPFAVITTLPVSVPVLEGNIARYGLAAGCLGVFASGLPVLALETDPVAASDRLGDCAREVAALGAGAIALGCAGMAPFGGGMRAASGLPCIDGIAAAVGLVRTMLCATTA